MITPSLLLNFVLYVPKLGCNLISVSKLNKDLYCEAKFSVTYCVFQNVESIMMIDQTEFNKDLYLLKNQNPRV